MSGPRPRWRAWLSGASAVVLLGFSLALLLRRPEVARLGNEIHYDDFGFAVDRVEEASPGVFVLTVRVSNHALRVPFTFDPHSIVLWDSAGRSRRLAEGTTRERIGDFALRTATIPAGEKHETRLVFALDCARPESVRVSLGGGAFFDALDWCVFGDRRIEIAPR